jgi:ABC-type polysaccharide/polyol phosphate export permease
MTAREDQRQLVDLTRNLLRRELRSRYKRSVLGWTWSLINPLSSVIIYTLVFSVVFRAEVPEGDPSGLKTFPLFLLCGLVPWTLFATSVEGATNALVGNASLIKKVYFPREALVFAMTGSAAVTTVVEMTVLSAILLIAGNMVLPWLPVVALLIALEVVLVTGIALLLSVLNVYLRDVQHFVRIGLQLLFYATPIIYALPLVPERKELLGVDVPLRSLFLLNPMTRLIESFRDALYHLRFPDPVDLAYVAVWAAVLLWIGMAVFRRFEPRLAEEL